MEMSDEDWKYPREDPVEVWGFPPITLVSLAFGVGFWTGVGTVLVLVDLGVVG